MAQIDILIWPTQTIFPEIHVRKTLPAAKAKNKRVDMTKRAICYINVLSAEITKLYLKFKKKRKEKIMSLESDMMVGIALLTLSLAQTWYILKAFGF